MTVFGQHIRFRGNLAVAGPLTIDGAVAGNIRCTVLTVSADAVVAGTIVAERATIAGQVDGMIFSDKLVLVPGCRVTADIYHRELQLQQGAFFEGKSRRYDDPMISIPPDWPMTEAATTDVVET